MGEFFGSIYCLFEDFFGQDLANYLWGNTSSEMNSNAFIGIGLWMLGISALIAVVYYYIVNKPSFAHWLVWLVFLGINAVINFVVGWQYVLTDLYGGKMVTIDQETGQEIALPIDTGNCLCFGVSNMLLAVVAFFLISLLIKWGSSNCSRSPL